MDVAIVMSLVALSGLAGIAVGGFLGVALVRRSV
jgi:hypothetical protein